jgi:hypothetical protein
MKSVTKDSVVHVTLCSSPCDKTLTAATVAIKAGGVSLWPCTPRGSMETKNNIFTK